MIYILNSLLIISITIGCLCLFAFFCVAINDTLPNLFFAYNHHRVTEIRFYDFLFKWIPITCIHCNGKTDYVKHAIFGMDGWKGNIVCCKCN
jgi:hypothetical protein